MRQVSRKVTIQKTVFFKELERVFNRMKILLDNCNAKLTERLFSKYSWE